MIYAWWLRLFSPVPVESNGSGARKSTGGRSSAGLGNTPEGSLMLTEGRRKLKGLWFLYGFTQASSLSKNNVRAIGNGRGGVVLLWHAWLGR